MSIHFTFETKPQTGGQVPQAASIIEIAESVAFDEQFYLQASEEGLYLELCPQGWVYLIFYPEGFYGDCQTNVAGAGFHKKSLEIIETIAKMSGLILLVDDETDFVNHRDFDELTEFFYGWLENLVTGVVAYYTEDEHRYSSLQVCWPLPENSYIPAEIPQTIVTPMGRFAVSDWQLVLESQSYETFDELAHRFFIWPDEVKNSRFHHNCALSLLWSQCYFRPSDRSEQDKRVNERIIKELEYSLFLDETMPIPQDEYLLLCQLADHQPLDLATSVNELQPLPIGYRRMAITESYLGFRFILDGDFIRDYNDNNSLIFYNNDPEKDRLILIDAYENESGEYNFVQSLSDTTKVAILREDETIHLRGVFDEDPDKTFQRAAIVQIFADHFMLVVSFFFDDDADKEWVLNVLEQLKFVPQQDF